MYIELFHSVFSRLLVSVVIKGARFCLMCGTAGFGMFLSLDAVDHVTPKHYV
jgi:hypothetical protein